MATLLMSYQPEDSKQPDNFENHACILLPTVSIFQRCAAAVDKLGLSVTPLVAPDRLTEKARPGTRAVMDAAGVLSDYSLVTEALHFPISALVDVAEETELNQSNMPTLPPELKTAVQAPQPSSSSTALAPAAAGNAAAGAGTNAAADAIGGATSGSAGAKQPPATAPVATGGRRQLLPFARLQAPWEKPLEGELSEKKEKGAIPAPPYPHLVGVRVKGALAGRLHGVEKTPIHLRLNAQPPPAVAMVLSFPTKEAAVGFVSTVLAFKKYHLSVALSTYLNTLTAVSQRQSERRGLRVAEEGIVAQRMMGQAAVPSVEPPPLPPRPADLPQANRLPRMVTNDEGEVFWYIPRKQGQKTNGSASGTAPSVATPSGARPMPVPQPDSDAGNPLPPDPTPRDGQEADPSSRPQAPPRSSPAASTAPAAAASNGASASALTMTPTKVQAAPAALFDCDIPDMPAPCLLSPTPTPGRK